MRKSYKLLLSITLTMLTINVSAQFKHPGLLLSQNALDRISTQIHEGSNTHITNAWTWYNKNWLLPYQANWISAISGSSINRGGTNQNFAHAERDFGSCWIKAVYYALMKNSPNANERNIANTYAQKAVDLLNQYANKITGIGGDSNYALVTAFQTWQVVNAAELLKDYSGWKAADQKIFKQWVYDVWYGTCYDFMYRQNGTCDEHYHSNWGAGNCNGMMAVGVYLDDPFIYGLAKAYLEQSVQNMSLNPSLVGTGSGYMIWTYKVDSLNAAIEASTGVKNLFQSPTGYLYQNQESGRDQAHCRDAVNLMEQTAEQAWTQDDDMYGYNNYALASAISYTAAWNSFDSTDSVSIKNFPRKAWSGCGSGENYFSGISDYQRGASDPIWQIGYNHYANRIGMNVPYMKRCHEIYCSTNAASYGNVETGAGANTAYNYSDFCGFGDLLFNEDSATVRPTPLKAQMTMVNGSTIGQQITQTGTAIPSLKSGSVYTHNTMINIVAGSTIKLQPSIADGSADTGKWSWDDDASITTQERDVTLGTTSKILRVHYTNASGAISTQMFLLHVDGDGTVCGTKPYYTTDNITIYDTTATVKKYGSITLGMTYRGYTRSFLWERCNIGENSWTTISSSTASTLALTNVGTPYKYRVTMTNLAGVKVSYVFTLSVAECDPYIITKSDTASVMIMGAEKGSTVKLTAVPSTIIAKAASSTRIFKWVINGDTVRRSKLTGTDLSDTITFANISDEVKCKLIFDRISSAGTSAESIVNFDIPVFTKNNLGAGYYYIIDASTNKYLRNTDDIFTDYNDTLDTQYQWRFRQLTGASYGQRYLIISMSNSSYHLSDAAALTTTSSNSKHSFDVLHKVGSDSLFQIRNSTYSNNYCWNIDETNAAIAISTSKYVTSFPFMLLNVDSVAAHKKDTLTAVRDLQSDETSYIRFNHSGKSVNLYTAAAGSLQVYGVAGNKIDEYKVSKGSNSFTINAKGIAILRFRDVSGRSKVVKIGL